MPPEPASSSNDTAPDDTALNDTALNDTALLDAALLDAALKKTDLVWVGPDAESARAMWHVWTGDAVYLMCGGGEQAAPVQPGGIAVVVAGSKDKFGTRLITFAAAVDRVGPGEEWDRVAGQMVNRRLNLPDGDAAPKRWARESTLLRLRPDLPLLEGPGHYDDGSHAAPPLPTPAGTRVPRPWHLFGRPDRRR